LSYGTALHPPSSSFILKVTISVVAETLEQIQLTVWVNSETEMPRMAQNSINVVVKLLHGYSISPNDQSPV
jgi:rRNA pseudouridine-1189 N-methylase Emg1 (Nep1/Mra1 family)